LAKKVFDILFENEYIFYALEFCTQNMLKKIFGSGARVKLLQQFLKNPEQEFFIRELTRILDEQINSLRRELTNLENIGLLKSKEKNRKKYYIVNPHFPLLSELTSIVRKTDEANLQFLKKIMKLGDVDILILTGKFINKEKDVDLFIVGNLAKVDLQKFLDSEFPGQNLKYGLMTREDFLYRITLKDKFVSNIFKEKDNLILKNKLKKDTENLVAL
jgi:predicted transcriptional regulator